MSEFLFEIRSFLFCARKYDTDLIFGLFINQP